MRRRALGILFVLAPLTAQSDAQQVEAVVREFFAGVKAGDAARATDTWSRKSPNYAVIRESVPSAIAFTKKAPIHSIVVEKTKVEGNKATATVRFGGKWNNRDATFTDEKVTVWRCRFVKEPTGWKFWDSFHPIGELAALLEAAPTHAERLAVLRKNPEFAGLRLLFFAEKVGEQFLDRFEPYQACLAYRAATATAEYLGEERRLAESLFCLATVHWPHLSEPKKAIALHRRALALAIKHGLTGLRINILNGLGGALGDIGQTQAALTRLQESLAITALTDPHKVRPITFNMLGFAHMRAGQMEKALGWFERSLAAARAIKSKALEMQALAHMAPAQRELGDLGAALRTARAGLAIAKVAKDRVVEAKLLNTIGLVHRDTGEYAKARQCYTDAIEQWDKSKLYRLVAIGLGNLGDIFFLEKNLMLARIAFERSLKIAEGLPHEAMAKTNALNGLGLLHRRAGNLQKAADYYQRSLNVSTQRGHVPGQVFAKGNLADVLLQRAKYDEALAGFRATLQQATKHKIAIARAAAHYGIGRTLARRNKPGDLEAAVQAFRKTIDELERTRNTLDEQLLQVGYFGETTHLGFDLTEALRRLGRGRQAFAAAEQMKARTIVDVMRSGRVSVVKSMTKAEQVAEDTLEAKILALTNELARTYLTPELDRIQAAIDATRKKLDAFQRRMYEKKPRLRAMRARFSAATLRQLQRDLFAKNPNLCVLSFAVGARRSILFEIRKGAKDEAQLTTHLIRINGRVLKSRAERFWVECSTVDKAYKKSARELFEILLGPVADRIAAANHVVIAPDGCLHHIPFGVLIDRQGKHLIESRGVSSAPSVTALLEMLRVSNSRTKESRSKLAPVAAFGNPKLQDYAPLPHAEAEAKQIAQRFRVPAVIGAAATEARAREAMANARRIHFATHGAIDETSPMFSFLAMTRAGKDDGYLRAKELAAMNLQADLVVLSACNTARGRRVDGEGVVGLTWALLVAGVPSQVVSRWQVHDESTRKLMVKFYNTIFTTEKLGLQTRLATCLRVAQLDALKDPKRSHPYYWAPFCLIGDWR